MASILIITDQPRYGQNRGVIATPSLNVIAVFADDIVKRQVSTMNMLRGRRFDTVLLPETITNYSSDYGALMKVIHDITIECPEVKISRYANQY